MISASLSPKQFVMPIQGEQIHFQGVNYYIGAPIGYGAFGSVMECSDDWAINWLPKFFYQQDLMKMFAGPGKMR